MCSGRSFVNFLEDIRKLPYLGVIHEILIRRLLGAFLRMFKICMLSGYPDRVSRRKQTSLELLGTLLGTFPDGLQDPPEMWYPGCVRYALA